MRQTIAKLFEKNRDLFLCFIDLEKAFDRVPRQRLFEALSEYGVDEFLLEANKSLYIDSRAAVRMDGELTESFEVGEDVRQGCCLSPLLFIIFIDKIIRRADVQGNVEVGEVIYNLLAFADDLVLLMDDVNHLQEGINRLNVACEDFGMKINVSKTKVMHVRKNRKELVCDLNDQVLEQVSEFKYLDTIFCEDG